MANTKAGNIRELSMKNTVLALSSAALFGFAATAQAAPEFFMGAEAGYQNIDMQDSYGYSDEFIQTGSSTDFSMSGVSGGIFAGMKFNVNNSFYLAPEVNFGTSNASGGRSGSSSNIFGDSDSYSYEFEAGTSYGLGLLAGFNVTEATSIYGRLGYQRTNFELTESFSNSFSGSESTSGDEDLNGVRYGVGIETALTPVVALRLDWSQTQYSDYSETNEFGEKFTLDPTESQFQVGVSYRF
jgi:outer membrane immunogenic protein